jgi:hypothetical protein
LDHPITKAQIEAIATSIAVAKNTLNSIRDDLTPLQWSGPDRERFHAAWEDDVNAPLTIAINSVHNMQLETL